MQIKNKIEMSKEKLVSYLQRMSDPRFAGQILFVVIVLMVSWSGIKTIQTNYDLQKQISALRQQNELQTLQNDNLGLENQYYNSNQYLELSARQNFGLAAPGEKEIIIPASVAQKYETIIPQSVSSSNTEVNQPDYQKNFESWINFFMHRQAAQD